MPIRIDLDALLGQQRMTQAELAARIGITPPPNLNVLKTGKAKAMRDCIAGVLLLVILTMLVA